MNKKANNLILKASIIRGWLSTLPFVSNISGIKTDKKNDLPYITAELDLDEKIPIRVPVSSLGLKLADEISSHWIRGMMCGTIRWLDAARVLIVFGSSKYVFKYRTQIRKRTGLVRKFRNHCIARRIYCTKKFKVAKNED